jgi:hypothetical protein
MQIFGVCQTAVAGMKRLWLCRYSVISLGLACANFLIVFGGTSAWSSAAPPAPHSPAYRAVVPTLLLRRIPPATKHKQRRD